MRLTVDVRLKGMLPLLLAEIQNTIHLHLIRMIVEQNVDAAHLAQGLIDSLLAVLLLLEVDRIKVALLTVLLHELFGLLCVFLFVRQIGDEAIRALHCKQDGCCSANTAVAAADQSFLVLELACCFILLVAAIFGRDVLGCWLGIENVL